jgi:hypothetical protein
MLLQCCKPLWAIVIFSLYAAHSHAEQMYAGDACLFYTGHYERAHTIPSQLLHAIALTESGRWHGNKQAVGQGPKGALKPWPWSINVEGKPYIFKTKEEAVQAVKRFRTKGVRSIDIGCMQVNLHHHPHAFSSIEQAFDPGYNVRYAAKFLLDNYQRKGNWRQAIGAYHSSTEHLGRDYTKRVMNMWKTHASAGGGALDASAQLRRHARALEKISIKKNVTSKGGGKKSPERLRSNMMVMVRTDESASSDLQRDKAISEMSARILANHEEK